MNKKILIGSIIAVAILVLVSFTGVVGYQTTKSSTISKASPLFSIRSKRAIDRESRDLTCDYVGKGEESVLSIPKRDDRTALQQKFIDMISKMDDKTFNRFIGLIINRMKQKGHTDIDNAEIVNTLNQIRSNQEVKDILLENFNNPKPNSMDVPCTKNNWIPGCLIFIATQIISTFLVIILTILLLILGYYTHDPSGCTIYCCAFPPPSYRE